MPEANTSDDDTIRKICNAEQCCLITKDVDFENSFYLKSQPAKLMLVTTGNISNPELLDLFSRTFPVLIELIQNYSFIEITRDKIIVRE